MIVFYLMNMHIQPRTIWLTRTGESESDQLGALGANACLSDRGKKYAEKLRDFIKGYVCVCVLCVVCMCMCVCMSMRERLQVYPVQECLCACYGVYSSSYLD